MKIYKNKNVYESALDRIRYLFNEFENISVSFSGGKDSTVIMNLALIVAKEMNRLPLKVTFIDQEAEWKMVVDYVRRVFDKPEIDGRWYQTKFEMMNAGSTDKQFFVPWDSGVTWMRSLEKGSLERPNKFKDIWKDVFWNEFKNKRACQLAGMRAEESPKRFLSMTSSLTYKDITWGSHLNKKLEHYAFYPLYDWSYTDIWKAIYEHSWDYCAVYDWYYRYSMPLQNMRVGSLNHAKSIKNMIVLQEVEPDTYLRLTKRLEGSSMISKMDFDDIHVKKVPFMFSGWREYRDYLLDHLILDSLSREHMRSSFRLYDNKYAKQFGDKLYRIQVNCILTNDLSLSRLVQWRPTLKTIENYKQTSQAKRNYKRTLKNL